MIHLTDGILLYHGSYADVRNVDLSMCRIGLDFGKGFYVTSSFKQAYSYIPSSVRKAKRMHVIPETFKEDDGIISVFVYSKVPSLNIHYLEEADEEWIHFVAHNRVPSLFPELKELNNSFDILAGKVANDRTALVLNNYVDGVYGIPGSKSADDFTISLLESNRLTDQFCFRNEDAVGALVYKESIRYGDI